MTTSDWIALGTAFSTLAGVAVTGWVLWKQLTMFNKQLTLQYFADYTKRYQEIIQKFPEEINEASFKIEGHDDSRPIMRAMRTYFDLCFEEWDLHQRGFIDESIWEVWRGGIKPRCPSPHFKKHGQS